MKTLENLNLYPYAIEMEVNGVTHNVLPVIGLVNASFTIDIQTLIPEGVVLLSNEVGCSLVGLDGSFFIGGQMLRFFPTDLNVAIKLIDFYQKMVGNKLVITLTPKQYLDLFTFDIAYEIVPK
jgi:hypothetical protein